MRLVTIEELKQNDVVLVNGPVPEDGGTCNRFYFGRVVDSKKYPRVFYGTPDEVLIFDSWHELVVEGRDCEERLNSFTRFLSTEEYAAAQLIGRWNPETRQVEPV